MTIEHNDKVYILSRGIGATSWQVSRLILEQLRLVYVPFLHRLQGRLAAQQGNRT